MSKRSRPSRIVITGAPRSGKTTLSRRFGLPARHTDDLAGRVSWPLAPDVICKWMGRPGPWCIEGVHAAFALARWAASHPGQPADRVIFVRGSFVPHTARQARTAREIEEAWREAVIPLLSRRVDVVYLSGHQLGTYRL